MRLIFAVLCIFQVVCAQTEQKKGFLVTAPSTLLSSSKEHVCVSLHHNTGPVQVSVTLVGSYSGKQLAISSSTFTSAGCLVLSVPWTDEQLGRLVVRLQSADEPPLSGNTEQTVRILSDPLVTLVSTDKPLYKPGQDIHIRVLSLTHTLRPHSEKLSKVWIETPSGIRVQQWRDVEVTKYGLVQLQFLVDKEPFLGLWKIKVQSNSSKLVEKSFLIKEYVPAKFEVKIHSPNDILPDARNISWNICARYSHGEIVHGDAHVEIKLQGSQAADQPSINNVVKLNRYSGCVTVTVGGSELGLSDPLVHPTAVHVTATVTEKSSGVSHTSSAVSPIQNQAFALHFQCSKYFKPGLPYKGNIVMKTLDGRPRPQVGEKVQVCVKVRYRGHMAMKLLECWNYTTDFSSHVVFALPDISDPFNVQAITLIATASDHPTKLYEGSAVVMMLQPSVSHNVRPWFSPSHSYLDVWTRTSLACETSHSLPVYYSVPSANATTPLFYYLVEARGDILLMNATVPEQESVVHSNAVKSGGTSLVRSWRLSVQVTPKMSPQSRITVYYMRADGEVVAASTTLTVDRCFQNKVRVRWDEPQVAPKKNARLCIRASPHSACGVSVIDRQLTFNTSHTAADEDVWEVLKKFTLHQPSRDQRFYCANKNPTGEELPPNYDLRRKRWLSMPPQDFSDHVDAITAFDDLGVSVMSNLVLETRPCSRSIYPEESYRRSWNVFENNVIDRSPFDLADNMMLVTQKEPTARNDDLIQSLVRDYFPDTWLWSLVYTGREGEATVTSPAPDTITSWDTRVICVSEREGLGIAPPTSLSVFTPFFIHVEAPYAVKKGENVTIKVIVYNFLYHSLPVVLHFPVNDKLLVTPGEDVRVCLEESSPHSHLVTVTAQATGTVNLTVTARVAPLAECGLPNIPLKSDTVVKQLLVKHDGFSQQKSHSAFICPSEDADPSVSWDFDLPDEDNLMPGSARLQMTVMADLLGPALQNLDSLVLLPMGCGEQNLARLAPNLFVLRYMDAVGHMDRQLRETALKNIKKGYQRQLTFQRSDGSFSAFGDKDETGSIWLTSAVVRTLSEARAVTDIDEDTLQDSVAWLTRQQLENGCFPTTGQLFHMDDQEETTSTTTLSALIIANLAVSGVMLPAAVKSNAEFCLAAALTTTDPYTLSLATLALTRLGLRERAMDALRQLMALAIVENDVVHWGRPDASVSHNIVTTSYAVLSLVELGGRQNLLTAQKAVRWISTHRNENGGFISTQDTVVALEALTRYITSLPAVNSTQLIVLIRGDQLTRTLRLTEANKLVQQQLTTTDIPPKLTVTVAGEGCAFVQSVMKYNVRRPELGSLLELQVSSSAVSTVDLCSVQELRLCARMARQAPGTSMALLTVLMVTGYSPDQAHLRTLSNPHIKKWEEEDDQIAFYLTELGDFPICFTLLLTRKFEVEDPLPAIVTLIDYYRPEISTTKSYSLQCSSVIPLDDPVMLLDSPAIHSHRYDNFHNVDFELETPSGVEGPSPVYACPPNSTLANCKP